MKPAMLSLLLCLLNLLFDPGVSFTATRGIALGQGDWKQEYASVCDKTNNAMALSAEVLKSYIERCDKLRDRLDELNGSQGAERKVYSKRLMMCRDLYQYVLDFKNKRE